jgi:hypothetical protein
MDGRDKPGHDAPGAQRRDRHSADQHLTL